MAKKDHDRKDRDTVVTPNKPSSPVSYKPAANKPSANNPTASSNKPQIYSVPNPNAQATANRPMNTPVPQSISTTDSQKPVNRVNGPKPEPGKHPGIDPDTNPVTKPTRLTGLKLEAPRTTNTTKANTLTKTSQPKLSPQKVREKISEPTKCKARPKDNKPKGSGGGGKRFVPWKGTRYGC